MAKKDGVSCPGCGLPNYEGLCPHCRGIKQLQDRLEQEIATQRDCIRDLIGSSKAALQEIARTKGKAMPIFHKRIAVAEELIKPETERSEIREKQH